MSIMIDFSGCEYGIFPVHEWLPAQLGWDFPCSALQAALNGEWPLRCEMKPKPSTRIADDLPE